MRRSKLEKLEQEIREVKKLAVAFKKHNGNETLSIPNKDMLLYLLTQSSDAEKRIGRLEGNLQIIIPIIFIMFGIVKVL